MHNPEVNKLTFPDFDPHSRHPSYKACAVRLSGRPARRFLLGAPPIFPILHHPALPPTTLWQAAVIGLVVGFASAGLTVLVYFFEDRFGQLRIHWMWWPALGGLVVGLGGLIEPRVLGVGYDTIHALLTGNVSSPDLVKIAALKALVWAVALGSGTSGGVLAPLLMMGGAVGTLLAPWVAPNDVPLCALVGSRDLVVTSPDELLSDAAAKMLQARIGRLPVVDPTDPTKLVGYLGRGELILGYEKSHQEEHHRERSWALKREKAY